MRRLKLFALAALALLALGAASVPSASAAFKLEPKACDGTIPAFCWEAKEKGAGLQELVGEEEVKFTQEETPEPLLEALSGGATLVHIKCASGEGTGIVTQAEPLVKAPTVKGKIIFKGCKVVTPATCTVPAEIKTEEAEAALTTTDVKFKVAKGALANIEFKGEKCVIKGNQPVTGEPECLWLNPEIDEETKLCEFTHEDEGLKLGANPASLLAEFEVLFPILEKEDVWDIALA